MRGSQSDRENRIHVSTELGGLPRFDRSLSTCCFGGGARERKGGLLVTAIYVRCHFERMLGKILLRKLASPVPTQRYRFRTHAS